MKPRLIVPLALIALLSLTAGVVAAPVPVAASALRVVADPPSQSFIVRMVIDNALVDVTDQVNFDDGHVFLNFVEVGILTDDIIYDFNDEAIGYIAAF